MKSRALIALVLSAAVCTTGTAFFAQNKKADPPPGSAVYRPHKESPILKKLEDRDKEAAKAAEDKTAEIVKAYKDKKKQEKEDKKDLRINMKGFHRPTSPDEFKVQTWHFPPVPQYLTGTCWCFSTTSFFESEVKRTTGQEIKLSELWTVYWEYIEKAKAYVESRGNTVFEQGSESEAVTAIWKKYGVVTESAYKGVLDKDGYHDHDPMIEEMNAYLNYCKENNYWDEDQILANIKLMLNKTLGAPPETVTWKGKTYSPKHFLSDAMKLNPDDYVSFISTESLPFWQQGEYKVEDNWRHTDTYYNIPLNVWYNAILKSVKAGSSIAIGGDVSEPGYDGWNKVAIVAEFDLPGDKINQDSREMKIYQHTTTDDHGVHMIGWKHMDGHDWFLIKDSARASRKAEPKGFIFYRDNYVKLKMLSFMVHKDFVKEVLAKCHKAE